MKKLHLFQLLFLFIILKLSNGMKPKNEQNSTFTNFAVSQRASGSSASWQQPSQNPKKLIINQGGGNFSHNSILSDNAANAKLWASVPHPSNEQFLDIKPQNIASMSIHNTYLQNIGMFID